MKPPACRRRARRAACASTWCRETAATSFKGVFLGTYSDHNLQSDNLSDGLKARGLTSSTTVKRSYDVDPAVGGPLVKDKLWFWGSVRAQAAEQTLAGIYYNLTPTGHAYTPDLSRPGRQPRTEPEREPAADLAGVAEEQDQPAAPERQPAAAVLRLLARPADERARGDLLVEVGADVSVAGQLELADHQQAAVRSRRALQQQGLPDACRSRTTLPNQVAYSDSGTGFSWGNYGNTYGHNASHNFNARFAASYVTGSHAFKAGVTFMHLWALDLVRRRQQRHDAAAAERRAAAGDGVRDAVFVLRDPESELGRVRRRISGRSSG